MVTKKEDRKCSWEKFNDFFDTVVEKHSLHPAEIAVWVIIFRFANKDGEATLSRQDFLRTGCIKGKATLERALNRLEELGLMKRVEKDGAWNLKI